MQGSKKEKIKGYFLKYREQLLYLVFGLLTTAVNVLVFFLARAVGVPLIAADIIAWVFAVAFAYVTNRKYVFQSTARGFKACLGEAVCFIAARIVSLGIDVSFLYVTVERLHLWEMPMKIVANVFVVIANYILSKVFVFRSRAGKKQENT